MRPSLVCGISVALAVTAFAVPPIARNWSNLIAMSQSPAERLATARNDAEPGLKARAKELGLSYPPSRVFFRAFKQERQLEVWVASGANQPYVLFRTYAVAGQSGGPGPKRREGDLQVPEGIHRVDRFNPQSRFWLSLGINYPNASDRLRSDRARPGGDIFIHGDNRSIGCLAMTDPKIQEIYLLALGGRAAGTPVHIFPCRMEGETYARLRREYPQHTGLWDELQPIYAAFERTKRVPRVTIARDGAYRLVTPRDRKPVAETSEETSP